MDWLLVTPQIHSAFSSLGSLEGDKYVVSPNALAILEEINYKLTYEDQTLRTFRRAIGFGQNVRSDLIPLLENTKDNEVLDWVIRILVNLTVPVECLFSVDVMYRTEVGRHTIFELNKLLYTSKEAFSDPKSTKSVVEYMKHILESDSKLSLQKCDQINNCLLLLRNILHIPEANANYAIMPISHTQPNGPHAVSMQNTILWNLFIQSIDKLLLYLMTCPQRAFWGVTMVQLIAVMYKDQHVSTLQKLLNLWFEASLSESSEDNESNTSPPKQGSGDSSPMLTSDPTSDSSDNGKCFDDKAPDSPTSTTTPAMRTRMLALLNHACLPTGSGGCKSESPEDRRQALRGETEATLQEVSRKGKEYQDALLGVPMEKVDDLEEADDVVTIDCDEPCTSAQAVAKAAAAAAADRIEKKKGHAHSEATDSLATSEKDPSEDATVHEVIISTQVGENSDQQIQITTQPAEYKENTTNQPFDQTKDTDNFMPPPALPIKSATFPQLQAEAAAVTVPTSSAVTVATVATASSQQLHSNKKPMDDIKDVGVDKKEMPHKPCQKVPHSGQLNLTKGKCCPQKRECPSSQSELSDCGYGTQVENQESISTSSNDDDGPQGKPQHQKPPCNSKPRNKQRAVMTIVDKKELRRKKLVKRSKSSLINMKGLVQHTPTDEDISNLLKEFTVDFLLKGYGYLVGELHSQLLTNMKIPIDTSHFFWLVTYFLKFAAQLELDMEHIHTVLTFDVISYLTYEGVSLCEQLELNSVQEGSDLKPYLRRMHLVVTAIREFLQAIETYKKVTHLSEDDREHLRRLQYQISTTEDLRCLFVLLLRRFNPNLHTKQYLQDLVVTNHILLLILDSVTKSNENIHIKMIDHISQFATLEVMNFYGLLLEDFNNNGEFVNDCIFTMMHHVGGDLGQIGTLFQPVILKTYSRIWEADYELCDDWSDLIEYVIHKFINTPQKSTLALPTTSLTELTKEHNMENTVCIWTQEEMDTLYWYYVQSKKCNDIVGKIVKLFSNNGNKQKSRISIIQQLLQQDIITLVEYDDLMKFEDAEYQRALLTTPLSTSTESGIELRGSSTFGKPSDDIQILRDLIIKEKKEKHLIWLQKILLECCHIKLVLKDNLTRGIREHMEYIMEPVAYHSILKNKSIPVVQWNSEHATTMLYQPFVLLLHKLGFQLPADAGSIFARIPDFWTPDTMFNLARKLGPLDKLLIKFDMSQFEDANATETAHCHHATAARASLSSLSSFEMEISEAEELSTLPEKGGAGGGYEGKSISGSGALTPVLEVDVNLEKSSSSSEIFAVPKAKHYNSIIRFTPDPALAPSLPNWLQLVMRSKFNGTPNSNTTTTTTTTSTSTPTDEKNNLLSMLMTTTTTTATATTTATTTAAATIANGTLLQTFSDPSINKITEMDNEMNTNSSSSNGNSNCNSHSNSASNSNSCGSGSGSGGSVSVSNTRSNSCGSGSSINNNPTTSTVTVAMKQQQPLQQTQHSTSQFHHYPQQHYHHTNDDAAIKLDSEYSAMVAAVYEHEIANSDSASVASDLTRMYVSDEEERHEFRVTNFP